MCNRYRLRAAEIDIAAAMGISIEGQVDLPADELFPRRPALVVRAEDGVRQPAVLEWGFPPPPGARGPVTNVRNLASPFWRSALANPARRCLIPASQFCEWEGLTGSKTARWFGVPSQPVFAFAGIWRPVENGPGAFAMLTCEPNALVAAVHPKAMPVLLHREDHDRWLSAPMAEAMALAAPYPSQLMSIT
jgi:putative SOS response-associated peptidase YedK